MSTDLALTAGNSGGRTCGRKSVPSPSLVLALTLLVVVGGSAVAVPQGSEIPTEGFRADFLMDLARLQKKVLSLAEAVPEDKYSWRPGDGVRSVSEAYMHMAAGNFQILQALGRTPPDNVGELEKIVDKETVLETLERSFAEVKQAALEMSDVDLESQVDFFGHSWSQRGILYLISNHLHEHLGQSIAYARVNGVVPPWASARQDR